MSKDNESKVADTKVVKEKVYGKKQIIESKKFEDFIDIVNCVVGDEEQLTTNEVEQRVNKFLRKGVK